MRQEVKDFIEAVKDRKYEEHLWHIEMTCHKCGSRDLPLRYQFCPKCGAKLDPEKIRSEIERRKEYQELLKELMYKDLFEVLQIPEKFQPIVAILEESHMNVAAEPEKDIPVLEKLFDLIR